MSGESVLAKILANTRGEVAQRKAHTPLDALAARAEKAAPPRPFDAALRRPDRIALIAEVKHASPSRGVLIEPFDHLAIARTYCASGASALSVLTDERFFRGSLAFLSQIRALPDVSADRPAPLLRKDFIVDPYQVYEARAAGADALLLIVAALDDAALRSLLDLTRELGMQALVEVHDEPEMERALAAGAGIVGINNRDLRSFHTALAVTERLAGMVPAGAARPVLVSESGIFSAADVARVRDCGADAVLVGEALITAPDIAARTRELAAVARHSGSPG
jgi:indole-3-glycerol phosphate synthase